MNIKSLKKLDRDRSDKYTRRKKIMKFTLLKRYEISICRKPSVSSNPWSASNTTFLNSYKQAQENRTAKKVMVFL